MAEYDFLDDLNAGSDFWTIFVRVLRKWNQYDKHAPDKLFCINMLLIDEKGTKMQASVLDKAAHEKFNRGIHEGRIYQFQTFGVNVNKYNYKAARHTYRITFHSHTIFVPHNPAVPRSIPAVAYSFASISDIFAMSDEESDAYLIDMCAFVKCMGSLEDLNGESYPKQILTMQLADAKDNAIECVLFDKCAADTAAAYQEASDTIIVAVLNLCRVSRNQKGERQVTSSFHATRVCLNEDIVEVKNVIAKLKGRAKPVATQFSQSSSTQQSSVSQEVVLCSHDIVPIDKIINQAIGDAFHIQCELIKFESRFGWQYDGCVKCASIPRNQDPNDPASPLWCSYCKKMPIKVEPKLKVTYTVKDDTDSHLVTFWNVAAMQLLKKTAVQMIEELPSNLKEARAFPKDLNQQIGKNVILKLKRTIYNKDNPSSSINVSQVIHYEDLQ